MEAGWLGAVLSAEPSTAGAAIVCSAAADVSVKLTQVVGRRAKDEFVQRRIEQALISGGLPFNHTVERPVYRAAVLAGLNVLRSNLEGAVAAAGVGSEHRTKGWLNKVVKSFEAEAKKLRVDKANTQAGQSQVEKPPVENADVYAAVEAAVDRMADGRNDGDDPLAYGVLDRICDVEVWENRYDGERVAKVREYLLPCFVRVDGEPSDWARAFALHFAQELKDDTTLNLFLLHLRLAWSDAGAEAIAADAEERDRQLVEAVASVEGAVGDLADDVRSLRREIDRLIEEQERRDEVRSWWINKNMFVQDGAPDLNGDFDRFHYRAEGYMFQGREHEIAAIERDFLGPVASDDEGQKFRWMALCGAGGTGKSRLAQRIVERQRDVGAFPVAGFVTNELLSRRDWIEDFGHQLPGPALLIVDYAFAAGADLPLFLRYVAARLDLLRVPIRVMVVVRRPDDAVLAEIVQVPRGQNNYGFRRLEVIPDIGTARQDGTRLALQPLDEADTVEVMRERMRSAAGGKPLRDEHEDADRLIEILRAYDERMRPLFACVVADALQRGLLPELDVDGSQEDARKALFTTYMREESRRVWLERAKLPNEDGAAHRLVRHVNLARLVTCAGGANRSTLRNGLQSLSDGDVAEVLPGLGRADGGENIYRRLLRSIVPVSESDEIGPVQPDLLAECLLLADGRTHGSFSCEAGEDQTGLWLAPQEVIDLAWRIDPLQSAAFVRLAAQDFPVTVQNMPCLPATYNDPEAARAGARALRNICADIAGTVVARIPQLPRVDEMERLFDLVAAFEGNLVEWARRDEGVREHYGLLLEQVATVAAFAINSQVWVGDAISVDAITEAERARDEQSRPTIQAAFNEGSLEIPDDEVAIYDRDLTALVLRRWEEVSTAAERFVWMDAPYAERHRFAQSFAVLVAACLYEDRDDRRVGGRALSKIEPDQVEERTRLRLDVLKRLRKPDISPDDVAACLRVLQSIIYAEGTAGSYEPYGGIIGVAEQRFRETTLEAHTASAILGFASNSLVSLLFLMDSGKRPDLSLVASELDAVDKVLAFCNDVSIDEHDDVRERFAGAFVRLCTNRNAIELREVKEPARLAHKLEHAFANHAVGTRLGDDLANGLAAYRSIAAHLPSDDDHERMLDRSQEVVRCWIDDDAIRVSDLTRPGARSVVWIGTLALGIPYPFYDYEGPAPRLPDDLLGRFLPWLRQRIGPRFVDMIGEALSNSLALLPDADADIPLDLLTGLLSEEWQAAGCTERIANAMLALWSRRLLDDDVAGTLEAIDAIWADEKSLEGLRRRTLALDGYAKVGAMASEPLEDLASLRRRLKAVPVLSLKEREAIAYESGEVAEGRRQDSEHDRAHAEALGAIGRHAVRHGDDPLIWRGGDEMTRENADLTDLRLAAGMVERMKAQSDQLAILRDLERVRALMQRSERPEAEHLLKDALRITAGRFDEGDPLRDSLEKEAEAVVQQKARSEESKDRRFTAQPSRYGDRALEPEQHNAIEARDDVEWHLPPPLSGDWQEFDTEELREAAERGYRAFGDRNHVSFFNSTLKGRRAPVPCYPGFETVELLIRAGSDLVTRKGSVFSLVGLYGAEDSLWLTGTSPGIHMLNQLKIDAGTTMNGAADGRLPLDLSDPVLAESYVRFFCAFVLGEDGPFRIVDGEDDLRRFWEGDDVPADICAMLKPPSVRLIGPDALPAGEYGLEDWMWEVEANVQYERALFRSTFRLQRSGLMEMSDDNVMAMDLPVLRENYVRGFRVRVDDDG